MTSTNLACNPRCLKEARLLTSMDANVTVVAFNLHNWTDEKEIELNNELNTVSFHYLDAGRRPLLPWSLSTAWEKTGRFLSMIPSFSLFMAAMAVGKRSYLLLRWARTNRKKYDLIIAHNPPAFYAAGWIAGKTSSPFALDVEDYHPGEGNSKSERKSVTYLMKALMKRASYASFASPLIKKYTEDLLQDAGQKDFFVVNNTFSRSEFKAPIADHRADDKLRIVWFSQFIDYGRGLEKIFPALDRYQDQIEVTLIGTIRDSFYEKEIRQRRYIRCIPALPQKQLHAGLSRYDVGLALEDGTVDLNRNLCLTNKIWSYLLAGLYIVASDTDAQKLFLEEYPIHGVCTSLSSDVFAYTLSGLLNQQKEILAGNLDRFERAASFAWENDSTRLTNKWAAILK